MKKCANPSCDFYKYAHGGLFGIDEKYCSECGEELVEKKDMRYCCRCDYVIGDDAKFCSHCGLPREEAVKERGAQLIYNEARQLLAAGITASEFSSRFFGPKGRLRELWDSKEECVRLIQAELYKWLQSELAELRRKEAERFNQEIDEASKK